MEIKIDKDIPMPTPNGGRPRVYPLADMEVGDSFFVDAKKAGSARSAAYQDGRRHGRKYTVLLIDGGCRVWRVK